MASKAIPKRPIAVMMARITFPYLLFMSLATLVAAVLNSLSPLRAAAAPILLNLCLIAALLYGASLGEGVMARARKSAFWQSVALSLSGLLQLVWLAILDAPRGLPYPHGAAADLARGEGTGRY